MPIGDEQNLEGGRFALFSFCEDKYGLKRRHSLLSARPFSQEKALLKS
jgi:hypothetical protein